jgi:hypothetical protein
MSQPVSYEFPCGRQQVALTVKKFRLSYQMVLRNLIPHEDDRFGITGREGSIQNAVMAEALDELRVNGTKITLDEDEPLKHLTDYGDEEFYEEIIPEILRRVVATNGVLWRNKRYARVFGGYAPGEATEEDGSDPTPSPEAGSTSSAASCTPTPSNPGPPSSDGGTGSEA